MLRGRAEAVHTVSGEALITLTRPDGQSIRLDGAMAMAVPGYVHLQAFKLGQKVFDLTLTPDGLWLETRDDPKRKDKIVPAGISAGKMARMWSLFSGAFFGDGAKVIDRPGKTFLVEMRVADDALPVVCEVDRETLTPRLYRMADPQHSGADVFSLAMGRYETIGQIAWPTRLTAVSAGGTIELDLHNIELNAELPPNAFKPPRRAEKIP